MASAERLRLAHPGGTTTIVAGSGALEAARRALAAWVDGRTLFVVSTPRVRRLHGAALDPVRDAAARVVELTVDDGEAAKTLDEAGRLWREMVAAGGKRDSRVVALGGGSCGDLAGFVAGCFLRGVEVAQVPTTLLAQVDAAIGGKTAVDLPEAKNSVGLFHHPVHVVADARFLATLPGAEVRSGLVEVVKMAFLLDPLLFEHLEETAEAMLAGEPGALAPAVVGGAAAKVGVVERDPDERDERRLLNFGHTLGHALETNLGYRGLRHGEAVAYGMLFALVLARPRGLPEEHAGRLVALLERFHLPSLEVLVREHPEALTPAALVEAMGRDKKAREDGLVWVLPRRLGRGEAVPGIGLDEVEEALEGFLDDPWRAAAAG